MGKAEQAVGALPHLSGTRVSNTTLASPGGCPLRVDVSGHGAGLTRRVSCGHVSITGALGFEGSSGLAGHDPEDPLKMPFDLGILLCIFIICRGRRSTGECSVGSTECPSARWSC